MKIYPLVETKTNIKFTGKRPNDSTYWVIKNPETASDALERGFVTDFLRRNPNWEKDEDLVHRLKQDTIKARAKGKIHSQWHEFDQPMWLNSTFFTIGAIGLSAFLIKNKNNYRKFSGFEKVVYPLLVPFFTWGAIDSIKYILTGRNLFEKKKDEKKPASIPVSN